MARTKAWTNSFRKMARAARSSLMRSFPACCRSAALPMPSAADLVADPISEPGKGQDIEGQHAAAQQGNLVAGTLLRIAVRLEPVFDGVDQRAVGGCSDDRAYDRADQPGKRDVDHGAALSF